MTGKVSASSSNIDSKSLTLSTGRKLGYSEAGLPGGKPVIVSHGHPGSRMDVGILRLEMLEQYDLRLITPDRPGIGISDFQPGRRIVDWPAVVCELADSLGIQQFSVIGISAGGPFAAATAYTLPDRVRKLALVSSAGSFNIPGATKEMGPGLMYFRLARYAPILSRMMVRMMANSLKSNPERVAAQAKGSLPPADIDVFEIPGVLEAFLVTMAEFLRQGPVGPSWEAGFYMRPWGFPFEQIHVPTFLWHGEADRNAPVTMGRDLANRIPNCVARILPGEGHFSLAINHTAEILEALAM